MHNLSKSTTILVVAGLLAAPQAWTKDETPASAERLLSPTAVSTDLARKANHEAARAASQALKAATRLDLDIQLIGPTSKKIAGER